MPYFPALPFKCEEDEAKPSRQPIVMSSRQHPAAADAAAAPPPPPLGTAVTSRVVMSTSGRGVKISSLDKMASGISPKSH